MPSNKALFLLTFLLFFTSHILSQTLEEAFADIAASNDMMGGSLVVYCEDGIIAEVTVGMADFARGIPITIDTKYRIASISKTVTAIAVMQLVEQGLLSLDDSLRSVLGYSVVNPFFPDSVITIDMLLSHRSSIIDGSTYADFLGATVNDNPIPSLSELLTPTGGYYSSSQFNTIEPGTYFNYSNVNFVILGTVVEQISGLRFDAYVKQFISDPLELDASFNVNDLLNIDQVAVLYRKPGGVWTPQQDNFLGVQPEFTNLEGYIPGTNGGRFGPQGGFRSSAKDLAKLFLLLMNQGSFEGVTLLSPESCEALLAEQWTFDGSNGNTLGGLFLSWGRGVHRITATPGADIALPNSDAMVGHAGEAYGLVSDAFFDAERKAGFIFLTNGVGNGYATNDTSAFYTVEQEVFQAIEDYADIAQCNTLSTTEQAIAFLKPFPNPTQDVLFLPECEQLENCEVNIYSIDGRRLYAEVFSVEKGNISLAALPEGIYVVRVNGRNHLIVKK